SERPVVVEFAEGGCQRALEDRPASRKGGRGRRRGRRHADAWLPVLTLADQCPATLMEVVMWHAVRSDVSGALRGPHRALEVLLHWVVLRDCGSGKGGEQQRGEDTAVHVPHRSPPNLGELRAGWVEHTPVGAVDMGTIRRSATTYCQPHTRVTDRGKIGSSW